MLKITLVSVVPWTLNLLSPFSAFIFIVPEWQSKDDQQFLSVCPRESYFFLTYNSPLFACYCRELLVVKKLQLQNHL
jgi:hypothetical protein